MLKQIIKDLKQKLGDDAVAVTASTGIAACNIGGTTLHSFAGLGLANATNEKCLKIAHGNKKTLKRWLHTQVLIIDESKF